jgi:hypothetical protein
MENVNQSLDDLFAAYRDACPDVEPGEQFVPAMWRKIEARQNSALFLTRWSKIFVTAAAALTLLMSVILIPRFQTNDVYSISYVDVLAAEHGYDKVLYTEIVHPEMYQEGPVN